MRVGVKGREEQDDRSRLYDDCVMICVHDSCCVMCMIHVLCAGGSWESQTSVSRMLGGAEGK